MMVDQNEIIDDWDPLLLEYPFVRKGMTAKEYDEEKAYYFSRPIDEIKNGTYIPLWKQNQ
ncbi:MAG: hypothetical protein J5518_09620 [Lachnospiraceae bacterium]|nr:hypothetical protein [Lachnospiraceae bacterium]